jgi:hypothetical protein
MKVLIAAVLLTAALAPAAGAQEPAAAWVWSVDPPPFGPNVSSSADGFQLSLFGTGPVVGDGDTTGGGVFELADAAGTPVAAGTWQAHGHAQVSEEGLEFPPLEPLKAGTVHLAVTFDGLGAGTVDVLCASAGLEGVHVQIGGRSYDSIVIGSTTLVRVV